MINRLLVGLVFLAVFAMMPASQADALGLKVAPLEYRATLKNGEVQQGFIDVSNPSAQGVTVKVSVQAFKQINNEGGLQFYDDPQVSGGVKLDLTNAELGPREALRLYFSIDSKALPEGEVYAAIFLTTDPKQPRNGVGQLVRVGTLLSIVNQTPGQRKAEITSVTLPFIQLTDEVRGTYSIRNTGGEDTGFYPKVKLSSRPWGADQETEASLVFGGRERTNNFSYKAGLGVRYIEVAYGDSRRGQWVLTVAPWMIIIALFIVLILGMELLLFRRRRKSHTRPAS